MLAQSPCHKYIEGTVSPRLHALHITPPERGRGRGEGGGEGEGEGEGEGVGVEGEGGRHSSAVWVIGVQSEPIVAPKTNNRVHGELTDGWVIR